MPQSCLTLILNLVQGGIGCDSLTLSCSQTSQEFTPSQKPMFTQKQTFTIKHGSWLGLFTRGWVYGHTSFRPFLVTVSWQGPFAVRNDTPSNSLQMQFFSICARTRSQMRIKNWTSAFPDRDLSVLKPKCVAGTFLRTPKLAENRRVSRPRAVRV